MEILYPELKETFPDPLNLFSWNRDEGVKKPWDINVVVAASHPAGASAILPLVNELANRGAACRLFTPPAKDGIERAATAFARNFAFVRQPQATVDGISSEIFSPNQTNLVIFGASGGGDEKLEISTVEQAIKLKRLGRKILIAGIEDDASGLVGLVKQLSAGGINLQTEIDALFLANRLPCQFYEELGVPVTKLIPIGPTGFDFLHQENTSELGHTFRESQRIDSSDIVIVHNAIRGTGLWSEIEIDATPKILSAIFRLAAGHPDKKFVFIYRFHPDDQQPEVLNEILTKFAQIPNNLKVIVHQPSDSRTDSRSPLAAADLVITTVSTTNTGVSLCGAKPESSRPQTGHMPLYFISPIAEKELGKTETMLPTASQLKAAAVTNTEQELLPAMENALFDVDYRRRIFSAQATALREIYRFKGTATATERVLLQIRTLLTQSVNHRN